MNSQVTDVLTNELSIVAWKIAGVIIIAGCLGFAWKLLENKILSWVDQKAYERKQKQYSEISNPPKIRNDRKEPTYEEWKAAKLAAEKEKK